METYIPSSSPLFRYSPCKARDPSTGYTPQQSGDGPIHWSTNATQTSIALDFTGTSLSFIFEPSLPTSIISTLTVDGHPPSPSVNLTDGNTTVSGLPYGFHQFKLDLHQSSTEEVVFAGAKGGMGTLFTASSVNQTIDDTAWRDWRVFLTPAWNMLEQNASNWINTTEYDDMLKTADKNMGGSISWTEKADAATTIKFNGTALWAFGITGGEAGSFEVLIDNSTKGTFNATGGPRVYQSLLYHASGLESGLHNLTLRNLEDGKRLSFDYLNATSDLLVVPTAPAPTSSASTQASSGGGIILTPGVIAAIAVSGAALVLISALVAFFLCRRVKRSKQKQKEPSIKPLTTFWRWSGPPVPPAINSRNVTEKGRPFLPLPSPPVSAGSQGSSNHPMESRPTKPAPETYFRWPSPHGSTTSIDPSKGARGDPSAAQTSFLKLSKSPVSKKKGLHKLSSSIGTALNVIPSTSGAGPVGGTTAPAATAEGDNRGTVFSAASMYSSDAKQFLDMGSSTVSSAPHAITTNSPKDTSGPKSRTVVSNPFIYDTDKVGIKPPRPSQTDLPSPRFSHAMQAAVSGQTTSPLTQIRESYSYFPDMGSSSEHSDQPERVGGGTGHRDETGGGGGGGDGAQRDRLGLLRMQKVKESDGSASIHTAITGMTDFTATPGGISDGYKNRTGPEGADDADDEDDDEDEYLDTKKVNGLGASQRSGAGKKKAFGGQVGWAGFLKEDPDDL